MVHAFNIARAHHRNIARHIESSLAARPNCSDGFRIVRGKYRCRSGVLL
jgi:hypothetical protein